MNDDENDYEMIQNMWNPEDPTIYWEELEREREEQLYREYEEYSPRSEFESSNSHYSVIHSSVRDAFLDVIEKLLPSIKDGRLRTKYEKFIKKHSNIGTNGKSCYRQITLNALVYLDPRLLIAYHKYLINRFSFDEWLAPFLDPITPAYLYLPFLKENIDRLALSQKQKQEILAK